MNYKTTLILFLSLILLSSCVKELDITEFTDEYGDFEQELRVEALMLPQNQTAIIRIDNTIAIDDESLFNCEDDNNNWVGSGCLCGDNDNEVDEEAICPEDISDCETVGGLWIISDTNPFIDGYCDITVIEENNCMSETFDLNWGIIDDVGEDGFIGDLGDEDGDGDIDEPSSGEGNGIPDCGEPNVDDLEEITESGLIHENNCEIVQIIYNENQVCNFIYSPSAGTIYEGEGLLEFSDGSGCQEGEILIDGSELSDFYYDYGAWIPDNCSENFFNHYEDGGYNLYIQCGDEIITKSESLTDSEISLKTFAEKLFFINIEASFDLSKIFICFDNFFLSTALNKEEPIKPQPIIVI